MRRLARPALYLGVVACVLGVSRLHAKYIGRYDFTASSRFAWAVVYIAMLCVACFGFGLPDAVRTKRDVLTSAFLASATGALTISLVQLFLGDRLLPRFVVFGAALAVVPVSVLASVIASAGVAAGEDADRVVVVGDDELRADIEVELARSPEKPATVVAHLRPADAAGVDGKPVVEAMLQHRGTVLVLDGTAQQDENIVLQAASLHESGIRVRTRSLFYEEWLGKIPIQELARTSLFFDIGEVHRDRFGRLKRLIDIGVGLAGALVLLVVIPVVVVANLVGNRGPLFYAQERVGRNGRIFRILKFRSMIDDASTPSNWTAEDDPRITRFGRILRVSHLDELPQFVNILRGDLSLVGPRPEQPHYVAELVQQIPFYDLRHLVRPGLTGWAQVKFGYAAAADTTVEKLQYDFHYLRRQSIAFDLRIAGRTIRSVLGREGR